jgi:predicted unusual protein kinase regulating ubiquinone biosynthesis (AarF/ABC1/UbiB family)
VHRATLRATGERVVVKVQNPEAERTFRGDVFALKVSRAESNSESSSSC